jgi:MFS family permease
MHDTSASWLMVSLAPSPVMVALMQTAATAPFFLLALPGGALADVVDRRRLLIATQTWMLCAAGTLGVLTLLGLVTPPVLLALTFMIGVGNAMNAPVWQAIIRSWCRARSCPPRSRSGACRSTSRAPWARRSAASSSPRSARAPCSS